MTKVKSQIESASGKLISAIQKEYGKEVGEPKAEESMDVMDKAHEILQASKNSSLLELLGDKSVLEFLGNSWVNSHPDVVPFIQGLQNEL